MIKTIAKSVEYNGMHATVLLLALCMLFTWAQQDFEQWYGTQTPLWLDALIGLAWGVLTVRVIRYCAQENARHDA